MSASFPVRRRALAGGAVAGILATATAAAMPAHVPETALSPSAGLLTLWQRYLEAFDAWKRHSVGRDSGLRATLVARWGDLLDADGVWTTGDERWGHDPDYPRLGAFNAECDRLNNQLTDDFDTFVKAPTRTIGDVLLKVAAVDEYWRVSPEKEDWCGLHEVWALAAFETARPMLRAALPEVLLPEGRV